MVYIRSVERDRLEVKSDAHYFPCVTLGNRLHTSEPHFTYP